MVLHTEGPQRTAANPLDRLVIEIDVGYLDFLAEALGLDRKSVILGGDLNSSRGAIEHWLIGSTVTELQLVDVSAQRQAQQLVAQADPEDRFLPQQTTDCLDRIVQ